MSITFDLYSLRPGQVSHAASDILMTNPTALSEIEAFWSVLPRKNGVPHRADVDPTKLSGLLEDCFILERVAPGVARIRVAGRNIGKLLGIEPRGLPLTAAFLPASRVEMGRHIEAGFTTPSIVELPLVGPRGIGQPKLDGKILMLPLRNDTGRVTRMLGMLVMSGQRGSGGRRFEIAKDAPHRIDPILGLRAVESTTFKVVRVHRFKEKVAQDRPALRLVVSND